MRIDGLAVDQLHREPKVPIGVMAAIEEARDMRMLEFRQYLTLASE